MGFGYSLGFAGRKRRRGPAAPVVTITGLSVREDATTGTTVGTLAMANHSSGSSGWTFSILAQTPSGKLAMAGANLNTAAALDYETNPSLAVVGTASKSGQADLPFAFTINVTNVLEVTLSALSLSSTSFVTGTPTSGTITGATSGSTITYGALPAGLTINAVARTFAWDGTGSVSTPTIALTETHPDASNSPRVSNVAVTISAGGGTSFDPALAAPVASLAVAPGTLPTQLNGDFQPGGNVATDYVELDASTTENFAASISGFPVSILIGTGSQSFPGLSAVTGTPYFRERIWHGVPYAPGSTYGPWSNTVWNANSAAAFTSSNSTSFAELTASPSFQLTANQTASAWAVVGGTDAPTFSVSSLGVLTCNATLDYETQSSYSVTVGVYNLSGILTTQAFTLNVTDVDEQPDVFAFTPVTNATPSAQYTSNTITLAGLGSGINTPVSITDGEYSKNGGAWSTTPTTGANGDTFAVRGNAPALTGSTTVNLNVGGVVGSYVISLTLATAEWATSTGIDKNYYLNVTGTPPVTFEGTAGVGVLMARATATAAASTSIVVHTLADTPPTSFWYYFGFDNGADDFSGFGTPGFSNDNAVCLRIENGDWIIWARSGAAQSGTLSGGLVAGDKIKVTCVVATSAVTFERDRGGSLTAIGTSQTPSTPFTNTYAIGGTSQDMAATSDFSGY